jgi:hypothetical protein
MKMKDGILPRKSKSVCSLTAEQHRAAQPRARAYGQRTWLTAIVAPNRNITKVEIGTRRSREGAE